MGCIPSKPQRTVHDIKKYDLKSDDSDDLHGPWVKSRRVFVLGEDGVGRFVERDVSITVCACGCINTNKKYREFECHDNELYF
jgi:hypothetical protein